MSTTSFSLMVFMQHRGYQHFCVWDQDILNAMREDLWGLKGVRLLPCRWSIFPMANWQFFWSWAVHGPKNCAWSSFHEWGITWP